MNEVDKYYDKIIRGEGLHTVREEVTVKTRLIDSHVLIEIDEFPIFKLTVPIARVLRQHLNAVFDTSIDKGWETWHLGD